MFRRRYCTIGFNILLNLCATNVLCQSQGQRQQQLSNGNFAYPENEETDPSVQNAQNKSPVFLAQSCREGEILYPGDQLDDWVCDCRPAYIYVPRNQACYPAYTRGPCDPGHYLVLPPNKVVPICQRNPCVTDNLVPYKKDGKCYKLDTPGPCVWGVELSNVIGVNETTLEIICTKDSKLEKLDPNVCQRVGEETNKTDDSGWNGYTPTLPTPPQLPEDPSPIKDGIYSEKKCFVGGRRWLVTKDVVYENNKSYYEYCTFVSSPPIVDEQTQMQQNIDTIFDKSP